MNVDEVRERTRGPVGRLIPISPTFEAFRDALGKRFAWLAPDVPFTDVASRLEAHATWAHCDREACQSRFVLDPRKFKLKLGKLKLVKVPPMPATERK